MKRWLSFLVAILLLSAGCTRYMSGTAYTPTLPHELQTRFPAATATLIPAVQTEQFAERLQGTVTTSLTATASLVTPTVAQPTEPSAPQVTAEPSPVLTASPQPLLTPTLLPAEDPYAGLRIEELRGREYDSTLEIVQVWNRLPGFTRSMVRYDSDGLVQYGFMNVPVGEGPFPVVIVVHGYVDPEHYNMMTYTTRYADALAQAGFLVIHPNLRGYPPSEEGHNLHRVGFAVDVLNLAAAVRAQAGRPGPLEQADPDALGLWGHSMGGGISIRAMTIDPEIDAVVLYGSMSSDERQNAEWIYEVFSNRQRGLEELETPEEQLALISPVNYLEGVEAAVSIHHGEADPTVPVEWSRELCQRLIGLDKPVDCFYYPEAEHTFRGDADQLFMKRVIEFFDQELR